MVLMHSARVTIQYTNKHEHKMWRISLYILIYFLFFILFFYVIIKRSLLLFSLLYVIDAKKESLNFQWVFHITN